MNRKQASTSTMIAKVIIVLSSVCVCAGHVCMLSPPQRTPLENINKPGSDSCILLEPPCGKTTTSSHPILLMGGSNFTVVFQKNLNHFNASSPGYWSVSVTEKGSKEFKELSRTLDSATPSLSLYTADITLPSPTAAKYMFMVLQTRYVTNNPNAPSAFYQCSDIIVLAQGSNHLGTTQQNLED